MASMEEMVSALRAADAAGDAQAATKIAQAIRQVQAQGAAPRQPMTGMDYVSGLADTAAQGLLLGHADEAVAAIQSALGKTDEGGFFDYGGDFASRYEQNVANERASAEQFGQENPKTAFAAEVAGAILPTVAGGAAATGSRAAGQLLGKVAGAPLTARRAAALGATEGGIYGFGTGEDTLANRAKSSVIGAVTGAGAGAVGQKYVAPAVEKTLKAVGRGARRALTALVDDDAKTARGVKYVVNKAKELGIEPAEMYKRVREGETIGQMDPVLMDVTRTVRGERPSAARKTINDRITEGFAANQDRIKSETKRLLGGSDSYAEWFADFKKTRGENARQAYSLVEDRIPNPGDALKIKGMLPRIPQEALASAKKIAQVTGGDFPSDLVSVAEDGTLKIVRVPTVMEGEMFRRGVNDAATKAFRDGEGRLGVELMRLEGDLRKILDKSSDALKRARSQYADEIQVEEAAKLGEGLLNMSADNALFAIKNMNIHQKDAVQKAVAAKVEDMVERGQINRDVLKRIYGTERNQRILKALFPKGQANRFFKEMEKMSDFNDLRRVVEGGSRTQQYLADAKDFNEGGMIELAVRAVMSPQDAAAQATTKLLKGVVKSVQGMPDEAVDAAARFLTGEGPEVKKLLRQAKLGNPKAVERLNRRVSRYLDRIGARPFIDAVPAATGAVIGGNTGAGMSGSGSDAITRRPLEITVRPNQRN